MGVACLLLGALLSLNFQKLVSDLPGLNNFIIIWVGSATVRDVVNFQVTVCDKAASNNMSTHAHH